MIVRVAIHGHLVKRLSGRAGAQGFSIHLSDTAATPSSAPYSAPFRKRYR
jgi:hypothetical protein